MLESVYGLFVILGIALLILNIVIIVKFFQIASDVRALRETNSGDESSWRNQVEVLVAIGAKDEARNIVLKQMNNSIHTYVTEQLYSDSNFIREQLKREYGYTASLVGIEL